MGKCPIFSAFVDRLPAKLGCPVAQTTSESRSRPSHMSRTATAAGLASSASTPGAGRIQLRADLLIYAAITLLVLSAKWVSDQGWYTPWSRTGYWIGVAGGTCMLLLFAYPLRKRWRVTYNWGAAKHWFVVHMVLGVLGPWLILLHSTFHIGSTNAAVALYSMLIVAASGVIGRFLYVRLNADVRGERTSLAGLRKEMSQQHHASDAELEGMPAVVAALHDFEQATLDARSGHVWRLFVLPWQRHRLVQRNQIMAKEAIKAQTLAMGWSSSTGLAKYQAAKEQIAQYAESVQRAAQYQTFERLFSLWHIAHVPFVWIMVCCAIFHIVAVHAY